MRNPTYGTWLPLFNVMQFQNASTTSASLSTTSKRQEFKSIQARPSTLAEIRRLGIARAPRLKGKYAHKVIHRKTRDIKQTTETTSIEGGVQLPRPLFLYGASKPESLPPADECRPSVVFIGRSNVGKSSLLNALAGVKSTNPSAKGSHRKNVFTPAIAARVSDKPGLTRQINIYALARNGWNAWLVDCPGYGFSFASEEQRQNWKDLIAYYLGGRIDAKEEEGVIAAPSATSLAYGQKIKRILLLLDARHELKLADKEFLLHTFEGSYSSNVKFQIVLTKCDLVDSVDLARRHALAEQYIANSKNGVKPVLMVSSKTGAGLQKLRNEIMTMLNMRMMEDGTVVDRQRVEQRVAERPAV